MATLILTLPPHILGGVATKAKIIADTLRNKGQDVTIGVYAARGAYPDLNVNLEQVCSGRSPKTQPLSNFGDHKGVVVGCRYPEFEGNYTEPSSLWRELIEAHDRHIAVGGTVLVANPLVRAKVKHLVWCAGDLEGDRRARQKAMGVARRAFDACLVRPQLKAQEQSVLACPQNRILGVSPFSVASLQAVHPARTSEISVLPIPTDMMFFSPDSAPVSKLENPIIGFVGRLDDPRKNAELLFATFAALRAKGVKATLQVTGEANAALERSARKHGIWENLVFKGYLSREDLRDFYRSMALLLMTSDQEGLAIVGIEAMACGVPVIATQCGGPEAYVVSGENGFLCGFDAQEISLRVSELLLNEVMYNQFSTAARSGIQATYALDQFEKNLGTEWLALWNEDLVPTKR